MKCPQKHWHLEARRALTPPISQAREGQKLMRGGKNEVPSEALAVGGPKGPYLSHKSNQKMPENNAGREK